LADEFFGGEIHTYSPAFKEEDIDKIISISSHVVFNSFAQLQKYRLKAQDGVSIGLRVNPKVSASPTDMYDPCSLYSRLGVDRANFKADMLDGVEGLHFHALCEQGVNELEMVLKGFEQNFKEFIPKMKWINFGGGHHITKEGYDIKKLIELIVDFQNRYDTKVYLEPGEAIGFESGVLVATVLDIVENGLKIAILDVSAEAHMPDTILMPYRPQIRGAKEPKVLPYTYRMAGNSCLSGDIMGDYSFDKEIEIGDKIIFEDQIHYTIVKNSTFNGIKLPNIAILKKEGDLEVVSEFGYEEYKRRN
jgi:carboxynorspermidine decarboxylase